MYASTKKPLSYWFQEDTFFHRAYRMFLIKSIYDVIWKQNFRLIETEV